MREALWLAEQPFVLATNPIVLPNDEFGRWTGFISCPLRFLMHLKYNKKRSERGKARRGEQTRRRRGDDVRELWPILDTRDLERWEAWLAYWLTILLRQERTTSSWNHFGCLLLTQKCCCSAKRRRRSRCRRQLLTEIIWCCFCFQGRSNLFTSQGSLTRSSPRGARRGFIWAS